LQLLGLASAAGGEEQVWINCLSAASNLEVKLWPINHASAPGLTNHFASSNVIAPSNCDVFSMSIGCDIAVGMRDQNEIPVTA
jgi:hypothetical protein